MDFKDYYEVLGCRPDATAEEIKKAYREIAGKLHPDLVSPRLKEWAERQMKQLNEAYEVLGDPRKRAQYDSFRQNRTFRPTGNYTSRPPQKVSIMSIPLAREIAISLLIMVIATILFRFSAYIFRNPTGIAGALLILGIWIAVARLRKKNS